MEKQVKPKNTPKKIIILLAVITVTGAGVYYYPTLIDFQKARIESLQNEISSLKEEIIPMRFKITEKTDSSITVEMRFYDVNGEEVAARNIKMNGTELTFDFRIVKLKNNKKSDTYLFFPEKVFTDRIPPAEGRIITGEYKNNNFPAIYENGGFSENDRNIVSDLYNVILNNEPVIIEHFGSAVHDLKTINELKTGFVYKIACHQSSGGVEIVRD